MMLQLKTTKKLTSSTRTKRLISPRTGSGRASGARTPSSRAGTEPGDAESPGRRRACGRRGRVPSPALWGPGPPGVSSPTRALPLAAGPKGCLAPPRTPGAGRRWRTRGFEGRSPAGRRGSSREAHDRGRQRRCHADSTGLRSAVAREAGCATSGPAVGGGVAAAAANADARAPWLAYPISRPATAPGVSRRPAAGNSGPTPRHGWQGSRKFGPPTPGNGPGQDSE